MAAKYHFGTSVEHVMKFSKKFLDMCQNCTLTKGMILELSWHETFILGGWWFENTIIWGNCYLFWSMLKYQFLEDIAVWTLGNSGIFSVNSLHSEIVSEKIIFSSVKDGLPFMEEGCT